MCHNYHRFSSRRRHTLLASLPIFANGASAVRIFSLTMHCLMDEFEILTIL